jgi:hypothetical protein
MPKDRMTLSAMIYPKSPMTQDCAERRFLYQTQIDPSSSTTHGFSVHTVIIAVQ